MIFNSYNDLATILSNKVNIPTVAPVDNAICRFDGVTGKSVQSSLCSIDDAGKVVIWSNTFSSSFPCQLEVSSSGYSIAKLGNKCPIYFRDWHPNIGFNLHYNSGWKFAHEVNTSTAYFSSLINFDVSGFQVHIEPLYLTSFSGSMLHFRDPK
jgi:hypothetical protein